MVQSWPYQITTTFNLIMSRQPVHPNITTHHFQADKSPHLKYCKHCISYPLFQHPTLIITTALNVSFCVNEFSFLTKPCTQHKLRLAFITHLRRRAHALPVTWSHSILPHSGRQQVPNSFCTDITLVADPSCRS